MRTDADEAARRFAAESFASPTPALTQRIARVLSSDFDGGDASLEDAASLGENRLARRCRDGIVRAIAVPGGGVAGQL